MHTNDLHNIMKNIIGERPLGSARNNEVSTYFRNEAERMGYSTQSIPLECTYWKQSSSYIVINGETYPLIPSPFSKGFSGNGTLVPIENVEELETKDITDKIVLLHGTITEDPLMPKNFPFFYPDEHKRIIDRLEAGSPKAVITITGKHPMSGLNPCPLFEDGNFLVPAAYVNDTLGAKIIENAVIDKLHIGSQTVRAEADQVIAIKKGTKDKVLICAHMDTKYGTDGAIDNASGLLIILRMMDKLKESTAPFHIEFVPFNGEEYYGVSGQIAYLNTLADTDDTIKLVINIDSPGHTGSKTALSTYNFTEEQKTWIHTNMESDSYVANGQEWIAGDHAMFSFQGTPCIAVTSSDLFDKVLELTHTAHDTTDNIDYNLLENTADFLTGLIKSFTV